MSFCFRLLPLTSNLNTDPQIPQVFGCDGGCKFCSEYLPVVSNEY